MDINVNSAIIVTDSDLIKYFTGFEADDAFLIIYNNENHLFVDNRYYYATKNLNGVKSYLINETSLSSFLCENNIKSVGLVYGYTNANYVDKLNKMNVSYFDASNYVYDKMAVKTQAELSVIKKACEIAEKSFYQLLPLIKEGVLERDLKLELEYLMGKNGAEGPSFNTIVAFRENSAVPHHKTGESKLTKNSAILIDFGCVYKGYLSDMTRTMFFGTPSSEFLNVYKAVQKAHLTASSEIKCGITAKDADKIARDVLKEYGYSEYFTHSLGHGVGVKIHEAPTLGRKSDYLLRNGNVFSIEPGVYLDGKFGVRIEDTYALIDGKCVSMMTSDKNPIII